MTRPTRSSFAYLAPGASSYASMVLPGASQRPRPAVDEHVVEPGTRQEMIDGRIVSVAPALAPHADCHTRLGYLLEASVAPGYVGALDLLTRTSERWNFATDGSVRKRGTDPATGHRHLEELAFEIQYTQRLADLTARARELATRGVRRVFLIRVVDAAPRAAPRRPGEDAVLGRVESVHEWSAAGDRWLELDPEGAIEDPCLRTPLRLRALMDAITADNTVLHALAARHNPALREVTRAAEAQGFERGEAQGLERGLRQAIAGLCRVLDIELTPARRAALGAMDAGGLQALFERITARRGWDV
jgi:hypothetical protein